MVQLDELIKSLQKTSAHFGNTCVYIRGSVSWGAVALNRQDEDAARDKAEHRTTIDGPDPATCEHEEQLIPHNSQARCLKCGRYSQ